MLVTVYNTGLHTGQLVSSMSGLVRRAKFMIRQQAGKSVLQVIGNKFADFLPKCLL